MMPKYIPKPEAIIADKWQGHGKALDPALEAEIPENKGLSGYAARLGYFLNHNNSPTTIRPNEYLIRTAKGELVTMPADMFEEKYDAVVKPKAPKKAKSSDTVDKKPSLADNKEVTETEDNLI